MYALMVNDICYIFYKHRTFQSESKIRFKFVAKSASTYIIFLYKHEDNKHNEAQTSQKLSIS